MKKTVSSLVILSALSLLGLIYLYWWNNQHESQFSQSCAVQEVHTGDSLTLICQGEIKKVKLCGIDGQNAKEIEAKKLVTSLMQNLENDIISVVFIDDDDLAEVYLPTTDPNQEKMLSEELLIKGLAKFKKNCPNSDNLRQAESIAKEEKIGIWK